MNRVVRRDTLAIGTFGQTKLQLPEGWIRVPGKTNCTQCYRQVADDEGLSRCAGAPLDSTARRPGQPTAAAAQQERFPALKVPRRAYWE